MRKSIQFLFLALCFVFTGTKMWAQIEVENVIDVTESYITNPSFETGDMTGWTMVVSGNNDKPTNFASDDAMVPKDGKKICKFQWWNHAWPWDESSVSQVIENLPPATYMLTCTAASSTDFVVRLSAAGLYTDHVGLGINDGQWCATVFSVTATSNVTIKAAAYNAGYYDEANTTAGNWQEVLFKVDNFRLYKIKDTDSSTDLILNPSYDLGANGTAGTVAAFSANTTVETTGNSHIYKWETTRTCDSGGSNNNYTYFGVVNSSYGGGTNGSKLKNSGVATALHGGYCTLIRRGDSRGEWYTTSSGGKSTYSNGSGTISATTLDLDPGVYTCRVYYKMAYVGTGMPALTLTATPDSGKGTAGTPAVGKSSINTGLVRTDTRDYTLNGSWDDFGWNPLSTNFVMTSRGKATISVQLRANAGGARAKKVTDLGWTAYYAFDTEALVDLVSITKLASQPELSASEYYFENVQTGQWLSAGATEGTHLTSDDTGIPVTLSQGSSLGYYHLGTPFTIDGGGGYMNDQLHCDGAATDWELQESSTSGEYYLITPNGQLLATTGESTDYVESELEGINISATNPASARWKMYTRAERIANLPKPGDANTDPVNVTFLIDNANFDRRRVHGWDNWDQIVDYGGDNSNFVVGFWNKNFDLHQTLGDLPAGYYALRAQSFYRPGWRSSTETAQNAKLYATIAGRDSTAGVMLITADASIAQFGPFTQDYIVGGNTLYVPDNPNDASNAFSGGYYDRITTNALTFKRLASESYPVIGFRKSDLIGGDWSIVDNFRLYYSPLSEEEALEEALKDVVLPTGQMNTDVCCDMYSSNDTYTALKDDYINNVTPRPAIRTVLNAYDDVMSKVAAANTSIELYKVIAKYRSGLDNASQLGDVPVATYEAGSAYTRYADGTCNRVSAGSTGTYVDVNDFLTEYRSFLNEYFDENGLEEGSDLTGFILNQSFAFDDDSEWTRNGGTIDWQEWEVWNADGGLTQVLAGLPAGKYKLKAQGFYRPGGGDNVSSTQNAKFFVGSQKTSLKLIASEGKASSDAAFDTPNTNSGSQVYVPNSMWAAREAFNADMYWNETSEFTVDNAGTATIGISKDATIGNDWTIVDNFRLILVEPAMPTSDRYYLYNKGNGQYLSTHGDADSNYGTQAMTDVVGLDFGYDSSNATFDSKVYGNAGAANSQTGAHFLYKNDGGVWLDGEAATSTWKFGKKKVSGVEFYYIKSADGKYLTAGTANSVVSMGTTKSDATLWQFKTLAQRVQELEDMESGDAAVDATFLLPGNDFTRGDRRVFDSWNAVNNAGNAGFGVYSADANNFEDEHFPDDHTDKYYEVNGSPRFRRGGRNNNYVFEAWHNPFDMYQELTGLPNGVYTLSGQCFDGENGERTQFYSESTIHLDLTPMSVPLVKDIMIDWKQDFPQNLASGLAGTGFTSGRLSDAMSNGTISRNSGMKIKVVNGTMKIGFRCGWDQWTVADNLRLTYRPFVEADVQEEIDPAQAWLDNMVNVDRTDPYDDGAFKIPNDEIHRLALQAAVNHADDRKAGTEADMTEGLYYLLPAAKEVMENTDPADFAINDPGTSNKFQIVGQDFADKVLTVRAANGAVDSGNENPVKLGFTGEGDADRIFPQAFTFEKVDGLINGYRLRYDIGSETRYLCTGTAVGSTVDWNDSQIRSTTDASKALSFRIIALTTADDTWYLRNNVTNTKVGHTNTDFYTGDTNYNMGFVPAIEASASVKVSGETHFSTLMLPFDAVLPGDVTAWTVKGATSDNKVVLESGTKDIRANVPYVLYSEAGLDPTILSGYGKAYADDLQSPDGQQLTGTFFDKEEYNKDIFVPKDCYVLSSKTYSGVKVPAFYRVTADNSVRLPKYRAYYTNMAYVVDTPNPAPGRASAFGFTFLNDGISPADIVTLVNIILKKDKEEAPRFIRKANGKVVYTDVNGDGEVTLADVTALVNMMKK